MWSLSGNPGIGRTDCFYRILGLDSLVERPVLIKIILPHKILGLAMTSGAARVTLMLIKQEGVNITKATLHRQHYNRY